MRTLLKAGLATAGYLALHSLLASATVKKAVDRRWGRRHRAGLYRPLYVAQSVAGFWVLFRYLRSLPREELYRVTGAPAVVMRAGQVAGMVWGTLGTRAVGIGPLVGWENLVAWLRGEEVGPPSEALGPSPDGEGGLRVEGPFLYSRHPLDLAPLPIFWLQPLMTTRLLGFVAVATPYLVLGSMHEETLLEAAHGEEYRRYQERVPFYLPRLGSARGSPPRRRSHPPGSEER